MQRPSRALPSTLPCVLLTAIAYLILASPAGAGPADWTAFDLGTTDDILMIEQTSFSQSWLVGRNGLAAQSNVNRTSWTVEDVGTSTDLFSIRQPSFGQVWLGGNGGLVLRLINDVWENRSVPNGGSRVRLYSRESGCQNALGANGTIYSTCDSGLNWTPRVSGTSQPLNHGAGFITSRSWIVGDGGLILKSEDGSVSWTPKPSGTTENLNAIVEAANQAKIVVGDNGTILRSTDLGETWTQVPPPTSANLNAIGTSGASSFWMLAVGDNGTILRSTDTGQTWCVIDAGTTENLNAVRMATNTEYIVGGDGGTLLRTTNSGGTCEQPVAVGDGLSSQFSLRGPYPHPVFGAGSFSLRSPNAERVKAQVFDLRGRRIADLFDSRLHAGEERVLQVDTRDWPAGTYFLRVEGESFRATRKMVVLR